MSELQLDDPDPLPVQREYPINYQTDLAYEGMQLSDDLRREEILSRDETADIVALSNQATDVLEAYGEGEPTRLHAYTDGAELHRLIVNGAWIFTLKDTLENRQRCRSWQLGGSGVSWCDNEQRYEEATAVQMRLMDLFPLAEDTADEGVAVFESARRVGNRLKRALASAILR